MQILITNLNRCKHVSALLYWYLRIRTHVYICVLWNFSSLGKRYRKKAMLSITKLTLIHAERKHFYQNKLLTVSIDKTNFKLTVYSVMVWFCAPLHHIWGRTYYFPDIWQCMFGKLGWREKKKYKYICVCSLNMKCSIVLTK